MAKATSVTGRLQVQSCKQICLNPARVKSRPKAFVSDFSCHDCSWAGLLTFSIVLLCNFLCVSYFPYLCRRGFGGRRGYRHGRSIGRFYYSGFYNRFRSLVRRINSANSKFACLPVTYKYSSASGVHQIQRCTCTCEPRTAFEVRVRGSRPCKQMKYLSRQCRRE